MVAVTNNDRWIRATGQWTRQVSVDTYVPIGMYCVRRDRVSPRRIVIGVEVDFEVAAPRSNTVV
jgi:2-keto-4-pentenoate hydratase/2-oxohepta-3-ene-1,7-dioic acid hydratase in catechol pathway